LPVINLKSPQKSKGEDLVNGYSTEAFCSWAAEFDAEFEKLRAEVAPLDGHYITTRYPNCLPDSTPARVYTWPDAEEALELTDQVSNLIPGKPL